MAHAEPAKQRGHDGERSGTESHRNARLAVAQVLASAGSIQEAAPQVLRAVCETLGWDAGFFWTLDGPAGVLRCVAGWHSPAVAITEFEATCRDRVFRPGEGLPGHVWATGKPHWLTDATRSANFPRAAVAAREGLHGSFACPIPVGNDVQGAIEFFSRQSREPDAALLEMMSTVAGQVGQFIERTRVEQAWRESEQRFARFMQHLPGLAWAKDLQGRYVYANDAAEKAFRVSRSALYGKTDEEVFAPVTAAQFRGNDRQALESGTAVQVIETLRHEDGIDHYSLVSKFPIPGPDGRPAMVGGMAIDISDRMRAEQALREADRLKDEFLAMLAHELRNPLAPIRNALHIIKEAAADPAVIAEARDLAERQVRLMARLLDDLLDVSRISRGRIEIRKEIVDVAAIIRRSVESVRPLVEERRHHLAVDVPPEPLPVEADPARLEQVLTNLLNNAAKYTDPGGRLSLTAESTSRDREGAEVVIRVRDTGAGIAPEMLPRIFDLFVQADRRLDRSQGGVGIGLTLVKRLVELHGGRVEAHSEGIGRGSEFVIVLPRAAGE